VAAASRGVGRRLRTHRCVMSLLQSFTVALESIGKLVEHPAAAKGTKAPGVTPAAQGMPTPGPETPPLTGAVRPAFLVVPELSQTGPICVKATPPGLHELFFPGTMEHLEFLTKPGATSSPPPDCPKSTDSMYSQVATTAPSPILAHSEPLRAQTPSGVLEKLAHTAAFSLFTQFQPEENSTGPGSSPVVAGANHMQQPSDDRQMSQRTVVLQENDWQFDSPPPKQRKSEASKNLHPHSQGACNQDKTVASVVGKLEVAQRKMERFYIRLHAIELALTDPRVDRTDAQIARLVAIYQDISLEAAKVHAEWRAAVDSCTQPLTVLPCAHGLGRVSA
jgi:hypothetical protein